MCMEGSCDVLPERSVPGDGFEGVGAWFSHNELLERRDGGKSILVRADYPPLKTADHAANASADTSKLYNHYDSRVPCQTIQRA